MKPPAYVAAPAFARSDISSSVSGHATPNQASAITTAMATPCASLNRKSLTQRQCATFPTKTSNRTATTNPAMHTCRTSTASARNETAQVLTAMSRPPTLSSEALISAREMSDGGRRSADCEPRRMGQRLVDDAIPLGQAQEVGELLV